MPPDLRGNITDIVLVSTVGDGDLTVLSTRVRITPEGALVCGALSAVPASLAVGKAGSPPELPEPEAEPEEELPETGGPGIGLYLMVSLLLAGTFGGIAGLMFAHQARGTRRHLNGHDRRFRHT
jgi:hypothetical protein